MKNNKRFTIKKPHTPSSSSRKNAGERLLVWAMLLLVFTAISCGGSKEDELPNPGQVMVDPASLPAGSDNPVIIDKDGNKTTLIPGKPADVKAGNYTLVAVTPQTGLDMNGSTVSLPVSNGNELQQAPEFMAYASVITVIPDEMTTAVVNLQPMTREVVVKVTISGQGSADVTGIKVSLYGVANQVDVSKGFSSVSGTPPAGSGNYYFTAGTLSPYVADGNIRLRLLGIAAAEPYVTVEITRSGYDTPYVGTIDATDALSGFNAGQPDSPHHISVDVVMGIGGMEGSITPWKPGPEVEM